MAFTNRRIVTGLNAEGQSCVIADSLPLQVVTPPTVGTSLAFLWKTDSAPANNAGNKDTGAEPFAFKLDPAGSAFILVRMPGKKAFAGMSDAEREKLMTDELPPEMRESGKNKRAGMHATTTVDYIVMIEGQVTLILEDGEVELKTGDTAIDRGVIHAWENRGEEDAVMATIMIDAVGP
jgi:mannose-6-phosphate isomerase-like protein (cupin superfamily)